MVILGPTAWFPNDVDSIWYVYKLVLGVGADVQNSINGIFKTKFSTMVHFKRYQIKWND